MVEDDDEESFGDFKFVMNSNQVNGRTSSTSIDDDDWGDFVDHSTQISVGLDVSNGLSRAQASPNSLGTSNPSDPFGFQVASDKSPKIQWVKPPGAIPLSIFGEEEEKEDLESGVVDSTLAFEENSFAGNDSGSVKKGAKFDVGVGINDLIANLYSQNQQIKSGSMSNLNMDFDPLNFNNLLNTKSNGSNLNVNGAHSPANGTNFDSDSLNLKTEGVKSNGFNSDLTDVGQRVEDDGEEVDDYDGWEFKAADSGMPTGDQKSKEELVFGPFQLKAEATMQMEGEMQVDRKAQEDFDGVAQAFGFVINGHNHGDSIVQASGAFNKTNEWDFSFNLDARSVAQHVVLSNLQNKNGQDGPDNNLNPIPIDQNAEADEYIWDFKDAFSETAPNYKLEELKPVIVPPNGVEALVLNSSQSFSMDNSLLTSDGISLKSSEHQDFGLNFKLNSVKEDRMVLGANQDGDFHETGKDLNGSSVNENVDFDEAIWEFKSALSDPGSNLKGEPEECVADLEAPASSFSSSNQRNLELLSNHQKALPLSIFGDERLEIVDDFSMNQDISTYISVTLEGHDSQDPGPNISINDLISNLYSQAEKNSSIKHSLEANENGINSSLRMSRSDLGNDDDGDSWEFKDASSGIKVPDQAYITVLADLHKQSSTKLKFDCYMDFYTKLNLALNHVVHGLLDNLKKAQSITSLSGEDAKSKALYEEVQTSIAELSQENLTAENFSSEAVLPGNKSVSELLEMLRDPKFRILDLEYQLSQKLQLAENDLRSAIELLKHAVSTLKILKLVSVEEQSNYASIWYEMVFICVQELKHGALIWKESVQKNVDSYILSELQGKQYICALGEIYRVVEVLTASLKLYKPWILLGFVDSSGLFSLLNECSDIWSSSGFVEALCKIDDPIDCKALLDSINFIQNLDECDLRKHVLSGQQPVCCLSLLSAESIPGLELIVWNGENYFLRLANLWANLIGRDPPFIRHTTNR